MPSIDPELEAYAHAATTPPAPALAALEQEARATLPRTAMLSGLVEGRVLQMLIHAAGARTVLELGTYAGLSALTMAEALPEGGRVITCEIDPEFAAFAQRHVDASPWRDRVEIRIGPALDTIAALDGPFDLVFIDADKAGYPAYLEAVLPKLSERGLIAIDNTLWGREVLDPASAGENGRLLHELNTRLAADPRLVVVLVPVRDGLTLIRRAAP